MRRPVIGNATHHYVSSGYRTDTVITDDVSVTCTDDDCDRRDALEAFFQGTPPLMKARAEFGVATFDIPMRFMQPSIYLSNATSGHPYGSADLESACCALVFEATSPSIDALPVRSNPFHIYRAFPTAPSLPLSVAQQRPRCRGRA